MEHHKNSTTRITLLGRLRQSPGDPRAWDEFVEQYGPRIQAWCRRWGAQDADAEDIAQMVMMKLAQKTADFNYDPSRSFRSWLKTIVHHAWYDFEQNQRRPGQGSGDSLLEKLLENVAAREDLMQQIDEECTRQLVQEAMVRVQLCVAPTTWEAFRLTVLEGLSGVEAGLRLGMPVSKVFVYKHRVQKRLEQEVKHMDRIVNGEDALSARKPEHRHNPRSDEP